MTQRSWSWQQLLPFSIWWKNLLAALPAFAFGAYFDLTPFRAEHIGLQIGPGALLALARVLSGLVLTAIGLALLRTGRDLLGLGRVAPMQIAVLFAALNALTAVYVFTARTVYVWDNAGYWMVARDLSQQWLGRSQIFTVLKSTIAMDYNYLLAWPISLVMRVFGGSRSVFLFAISDLYTMAGLWGLCALARQKKWGGLSLAALFPMFIYNGVVGFVDVASCSLAIWAFVIYTSDRPAASRGIFTGALLVGTFLFRRYFFFFAASFGLAAFAAKLLFDRRDWTDFIALFCSSALCSLYFAPNFLLEKILNTDYKDIYSAFQLGLSIDLKLFFRYFGVFLILLPAWGLWQLKRGRGRLSAAMVLIQLSSCFAALTAVQSHGQQHLLLYLPGLAVLAASLELSARTAWAAALVTAWCLLPKAQPTSPMEIRHFDVLPSFVFYGPVRPDIDQLKALADYVDSLSAQEEKTAMVLASSNVISIETLKNLRPSLGLPGPEARTVLVPQGLVDKRDGFNWDVLTVDYLIVGDPVQADLGEEDQQVFTLLAHDVLSGTGAGSAYAPLPETFLLSDGVTVRIFQRMRDLTAEECHSIADRLTARYPEYAAQYAVPDWVG